MPRYDLIHQLYDLKDRIDIFIRHEMQPLAHGPGADTLDDLTDRLTSIAAKSKE